MMKDMKELKIKICGMKDAHNIAAVIRLNPDYMGFILYDQSPRHVTLKEAARLVKNIPSPVKKAAVLVNETIDNALGIAETGIFDILQLHGDESPDYCRRLSLQIPVIKAFRISKALPGNMKEYEPFCSMFLFDSAGEKFGGTGKKYDHGILSGYDLNTEFILSGGITENDADNIKSSGLNKMAGVDLNSRFEVAPGIKNICMLQNFIEKFRKNDDND